MNKCPNSPSCIEDASSSKNMELCIQGRGGLGQTMSCMRKIQRKQRLASEASVPDQNIYILLPTIAGTLVEGVEAVPLDGELAQLAK